MTNHYSTQHSAGEAVDLALPVLAIADTTLDFGLRILL